MAHVCVVDLSATVISSVEFILPMSSVSVIFTEVAAIRQIETFFVDIFACSLLLSLPAVSPSLDQFLLILGLELLFDLKFVLHDLLLCFENQGLLVHLHLLSVELARDAILHAEVQVDSDLARILGFQSKAIDRIGLSLLINELGSN